MEIEFGQHIAERNFYIKIWNIIFKQHNIMDIEVKYSIKYKYSIF